MSTAPQIVIGTAGHIDHGKSRLVLALTGSDPDRLPEEKARGMTIDLGFAHTRIDECDVWFVDVPGHERFIRNMVAGATGVDIALLVVAADDSVMPQTREHAEVLSLLGVERCIVALTKMDLVDDEWGEAVEEEIRELLESLNITPIEIVRTSAETGRGLDELRVVLADAARAQSKLQEGGFQWFRLPVDRAFNVSGRGTVATGSVFHGSVKVEDELDIWPEGRRVRVRDLQSHYEGAEQASGHMRLALNLAGVSLDEVKRGCELATPGCMETTRRMDVWIASIRMPGKVIRKNIRLRLHIATSEVLAELRLLEPPSGLAMRDQYAQLRVAVPVVATWGQRFILRDESGRRTLGGGRVLRPVARPWTGRRPAHLKGLQALREGGVKQRLEEVIRANEWRTCDDRLLASRAGLPRAERIPGRCKQLIDEGLLEVLMVASTPAYIHRSHLDRIAAGVDQRLKEHLAANPRLPGVPRGEWPAWMPRACPQKLRPALAERLIEHEHVALADNFIVPVGHAGSMSPEDQKLYDAVLAEFEAGRFQPPAIKNLTTVPLKNIKRIRELVKLAAARGKLIHIAEDIWLHENAWKELVAVVVAAARERGGLTVGDIRTLLDSSRKYVVPIAEYLDKTGVTRRVGDNRVLGSNPDGVI